MDVIIEPRHTCTWDEFLQDPPKSIALDGYVLGGPRFDERTLHVNFDHHDGVVREATMATCMQVHLAIKGGLMDAFTPPNVYINDTDQDTALAVWLLRKHKLFEGTGSIPHINRLLHLTNWLDITGGAYPMNLDDELLRHHNWIFEPYTELRISGELARAPAIVLEQNLDAVCARLDSFMMGKAGERPLDTRYELVHETALFKLYNETGGNEARYHLYGQGMRAFVARVATRPDGRFVYSIGRRSRYIPFPVPHLLKALSAADTAPWGGSDLIGGSNRERGSSLDWDMIDSILTACLGGT